MTGGLGIWEKEEMALDWKELPGSTEALLMVPQER